MVTQMSDVKPPMRLVPHRSKSKKIIHDCLRRVLKLAERREMEVMGVFMVDVTGRVHLDKIGPVNWEQTDKMLTALEALHEDIYLAMRDPP